MFLLSRKSNKSIATKRKECIVKSLDPLKHNTCKSLWKSLHVNEEESESEDECVHVLTFVLVHIIDL